MTQIQNHTMMLFQAPTVAAASVISSLLLSLDHPRVPVVDVIKVYGSLATPECYGSKAPAGSSCQVSIQKLEEELGLLSSSSISQQDFVSALDNLDFQWPLKPYGLNDDSLRKTATMNKGAETRVYMEELERRGLYDRRNPTGPLPTSLRPKLNKVIQSEPLEASVSQRVFEALGGDSTKTLTKQALENRVGETMDYYSFIDLIGKQAIEWPN